MACPRRLVPCVWLWPANLLRLRRLLAHCNWGSAHARFHPAGEFRSPLCLHHTLHVLDALAHVPFLLDSRLCLPADGNVAPRRMVAQALPPAFDGALRHLAQGNHTFPALRFLSRSVAHPPSPSATGRAKIRLAEVVEAVDCALLGDDHGASQPGMDFFSRRLTAPGWANVLSAAVAPRLHAARSSKQLISSGRSRGCRLRGRPNRPHCARQLRRASPTLARPEYRRYRPA